MSRLPFEQMMASLRPAPTGVSKLGRMSGVVSVVVMASLPSCCCGRGRDVWSGRGGCADSDASVGLGQARDVGHLLGRLLREELEQHLRRYAAGDGYPA